jgi:hypothetical protein
MNIKKLTTLAILSSIPFLYGCTKESNSNSNPVSKHQKDDGSTPGKVEAKPKSKSYDGPFGLAMGITIPELEKQLSFTASPNKSGLLYGEPPKPSSNFTAYAVLATPNAGLCRILASVNFSTVNGSGDQLKEAADKFAELLELKYGKPSSKTEYFGQDVYRRNPQYWLMGLKEDSVAYGYEWEKKKSPLPNQLREIEITTNADSINSGYIMIKYTFENYDDCKKEMNAVKAENL